MTEDGGTTGDGAADRGTKGGGTASAGTTALAAIVENATGRPVPGAAAGTILVERDGEGADVGDAGNTDDAADIDRLDDDGPVALLASVLADASSLVGVVPRIDPGFVERLSAGGAGYGTGDGSEPTGLDARLVFVGEARDRVTGPTGIALRPLLDGSSIEVSVASGESPIGVLLVDDRAVVGRFDDAGLAELLVTDDDVVREWATRTVRRYLEVAESP